MLTFQWVQAAPRPSLSLPWLLAEVALLLALTPCILYFVLRIINLGSSPITTAQVAFDKDKYGKYVKWDKHCLYLLDRPTIILSGEFHYWRLPDRSRWEYVLRQYKQCGLNCIRIYFSWAYHSPQQGVYHFDGNRDLDYLLTLCEDIGLYVLAAPGPYICAETQGGGIPSWLVAMRNVRIRHSCMSFYRVFDQKYSDYCAEWFQAILPILSNHQITRKVNGSGHIHGCLIALQIENESFETFSGFPLGLADDMKHLSKTARDCGINVPLFTNDGWEAGSFVSRPENARVLGQQPFGLDLYGFDKYAIFCPTSSPLAAIKGASPKKETWSEWNPTELANSVDSMEKKVRSFGGGAASLQIKSPIFIPELQGGWFNHYTMTHTYDDIYDYYGEEYTHLLFDHVISQGITMLNFYMFYGGTNWGTLGDPDVYTSYDYSACIREFGMLSGRARRVRLGFFFVRSFEEFLVKTDPCEGHQDIAAQPDSLLFKRRRSLNDSVEFLFFRNFSPDKKHVKGIIKDVKYSISIPISIPYKSSIVTMRNYTPRNGMHLLLSSCPIHVRTFLPEIHDKEVWILQCDAEGSGALVFKGPGVAVISGGTLKASVEMSIKASIITFKEASGWTLLTSPTSAEPLLIIALAKEDLYTLDVQFPLTGTLSSCNPARLVTWGVSMLQEQKDNLYLEERVNQKSTLYMLGPTSNQLNDSDFSVPQSGPFAGCPYIRSRTLPPVSFHFPAVSFQHWTSNPVVFEDLPWQALPLQWAGVPGQNQIDLGFTSGHMLYKLGFILNGIPATPPKLNLNMRHRCTIYINGRVLGGHCTYSLGVGRAGSKNGPDIGLLGGMKDYVIPLKFLRAGENMLVVLTESWGLNRQPFALNDVRNPRGILRATLSCAARMNWSVCGVDVRSKLTNPFSVCGIPESSNGKSTVADWVTCNDFVYTIPASMGGSSIPTWYSAGFSCPSELDPAYVRCPLRLHLSGMCTAYVEINGVLMARYYGNGDGPQHDFHIPDGLLEYSTADVKTENKIRVLVYAQDNHASLSISVKAWHIRADDWSGNLAKKEGVDFALYRQWIR